MGKLLRFILLATCLLAVAAAGPAVSMAAGVSDAPDSAVDAADTQAPDEYMDDPFLDTLYEEAEKGTVSIPDPLAPLNRVMFQINDKLYFWILKPVARGYRAVVPTPVRTCIANFFNNLTTPIRMANCLLQHKTDGFEAELARFMLNSTVGVLGFWDPAKKYYNLAPSREDLGQTLGTYGIGNGFYIVWPVLGPSTLRDTVGMVGDRFLNPVTYVDPTEAAVAVTGADTINDTSFHIGDCEAIKSSTLQPYEAIRDAYIQSRQSKVEE